MLQKQQLKKQAHKKRNRCIRTTDITAINKALKEENWAHVKELIINIKDDDEVWDNGESSKSLISNLILANIKLKKSEDAEFLLDKNKEIFTEKEIEEIKDELDGEDDEEEITDENGTKIKGGVIQQFGFFTSDTKFKDVIGLEKVKEELKKKIIYQIKYADKYEKMGVELSNGTIFYGPPGTGKTLLARAVAGEIGGRMIVVKLPDIINKFAGDSEKNIKKIFEEAKRQKPAIIFLDEIDGIGQKRENADNDAGQGALTHNIVTTLLSEIDGISKDMKNVYTIGTTNKPWALDSALTRSGRISNKLYIPLPIKGKERSQLFRFHLQKIPISHIDYLKLGYASFGLSPADIHEICQEAAMNVTTSIIEGNRQKTNKKLTTTDIIKAINKKQKQSNNMEWFSDSARKLKDMPKNEIKNQYGALLKDIRFWYLKAPQYRKIQKFISLIV